MKFAAFAGALCLLLAAQVVSAQNYFVPEGKNSTLLGGSWFDEGRFKGWSIDAAVSINGAVSLGVLYERIEPSYLRIDYDEHYRASLLSPYLSALVFRPKAEFPIGVECRAGYGLSSLDGLFVDVVDSESHGTTLWSRLDAVLYLPALEKLRLWPHFGGAYYVWSLETPAGFSAVDSSDVPSYRWTAGLSLQIAEDLVLSADQVKYEGENSAVRLSLLVLYNQREWWQSPRR